MQRQMSTRTAAALSVGGLCAVTVALIPNVCLAVYMLNVAKQVEDSPTCLAPYQMEYSFDGTVPGSPLSGSVSLCTVPLCLSVYASVSDARSLGQPATATRARADAPMRA